MDRFSEGDPLLDTLYKGVIGRRDLVVAPDCDFVECCKGVKDLDGFGRLFISQTV
jgi:hypothetical protein